jgi:hypothetical protein
MSIIEGQEAGLSRDPNQVSPAQRALLSVWNDVIAIERQTLDQITLSDLLERLRSDDANMYFI